MVRHVFRCTAKASPRLGGSPEHPAIEPDDHPDEAEHSEPRGRRKAFWYEPDRRVLREADDETGVDHSPQALAHNEP